MLRFSKWPTMSAQQVARPRHAALEEREPQLGEAASSPRRRTASGRRPRCRRRSSRCGWRRSSSARRGSRTRCRSSGRSGRRRAPRTAARAGRSRTALSSPRPSTHRAARSPSWPGADRSTSPPNRKPFSPSSPVAYSSSAMRLVRVVGRDDPDRDQAVASRGRRPRRSSGCTPGPAARRSSSSSRAITRQPDGRIQDGDVDAELVEALVEQAREHGRGPVEGVAGRNAPPAGAGQAAGPAGCRCRGRVAAPPSWTRR